PAGRSLPRQVDRPAVGAPLPNAVALLDLAREARRLPTVDGVPPRSSVGRDRKDVTAVRRHDQCDRAFRGDGPKVASAHLGYERAHLVARRRTDDEETPAVTEPADPFRVDAAQLDCSRRA